MCLSELNKKLKRRKVRGKIKSIDLRYARLQVVRFRKQEEGKMLHKLHVLGMNNNFWNRVREEGSETWKGCV